MTEQRYFDIFGFLMFAKLLTKREIVGKLWETLEGNIEIFCPTTEQADSVKLLIYFYNVIAPKVFQSG